MPTNSIISQLDEAVSSGGNAEELLRKILAHFDAQTGTIHRFNPVANRLKLIAQVGIPPTLLDRISEIPLGKGIAGVAALERRPVTVCNLQDDNSGVARPGAKLTGMEGAIAVPMLSDGELRGTLGVAKNASYNWSDDDIQTLNQIAALLCRVFSKLRS